ncbi:MAG: SAM-dependent methyltransferase [Campylobacteraceae bacterium]|nr:SAM-dependent methyltransferase [Campylobacteraceae bacterium]
MVKFSEYMSKWLYGDKGYYKKHRDIGKKGDFYTAVSSSMFFGGSIAKRVISVIQSGFLSPTCSIVEIGAHKGYLLADMIQFIYTLQPKLLETLNFIIVEPFTQNRKIQLKYFKDSFGESIKLTHVSNLKELKCDDAFFIANEIFDAFPCEIIKDNKMLYLCDGKLKFDKLNDITDKLSFSYDIHNGEIPLDYESFADNMYQSANRYEFVTFDYGDRFAREDFSIRVYSEHSVYPFFSLSEFAKDEKTDKNFDEFFKNSDITYDVNFDYLIRAYEKSGAKLESYSSQFSALMSFGLVELLEILQKNSSKKTYEQEINKVKILIDPSMMGERFKMASFRKI